MKDAKPKFDVVAHNRSAWDRQVEGGNIWTLPVMPEQVARARRGDWSVLLTETKPVPASWFPLDVGGRFLPGVRVLCLASGGGQQGPILSAAGAIVTVFDNSPRQLERDRMVAERDGLRITTVQGDMIDLSAFADESFDLVFHPVSNVFSAEVLPVYREAYRVLIRGGTLLAGFMNPDLYILDMAEEEQGRMVVRYKLPYSDLESLSEAERVRLYGPDDPLEWSHTLQEQIGGQLQAGFVLTDFYEDHSPERISSEYFPRYFATRALKR